MGSGDGGLIPDAEDEVRGHAEPENISKLDLGDRQAATFAEATHGRGRKEIQGLLVSVHPLSQASVYSPMACPTSPSIPGSRPRPPTAPSSRLASLRSSRAGTAASADRLDGSIPDRRSASGDRHRASQLAQPGPQPDAAERSVVRRFTRRYAGEGARGTAPVRRHRPLLLSYTLPHLKIPTSLATWKVPAVVLPP